MRAILMALGGPETIPLVTHRIPNTLLQIVDKPLIHHIFDYFVFLRISHVHLVLHHLPYLIEESIDEGKRWGISVTIHLAKELENPWPCIMPLVKGLPAEERILLAHGEKLPEKEFSLDKSCLYQDEKGRLTGWGVVTASDLPECKTVVSTEVSTFLSTSTTAEWYQSNLRVLEQHSSFFLFPTTARQVEEKIWISHGVILHPSATVKGPVFIGENTQIRERTQVGPFVVLGNQCFVDEEATIQRSVVMANSYLGQGITVEHCMISGSLLFQIEYDSHIDVSDERILSNVTLKKHHYFHFLKRCLAAFLYILFFPIYILLHICYPLTKTQKMLLPATENPKEWKTFEWTIFEGACCFPRLPLLLSIVRGEMDFVGIAPYQPSEVIKLPLHWRAFVLSSKIGLITLSELDNGTNLSQEQRFASEAYYTAHQSFWLDCKLVWRWILKKMGIVYKSRGTHA